MPIYSGHLETLVALGRFISEELWYQCHNSWRSWHLAAAATVLSLGGAYQIRTYWRSRDPLSSKQIIAVTGCDSGLGYSLAIHCRDKGAQVIAGVLRDNGPAARDLRHRGIKVQQLDITNRLSVQKFRDVLERVLKDEELELRALVNNAGIMVFGEFEWQLAEQARSQLEVNVIGTMSITRHLMPLLRHHKSRIVNVTSHCAVASLPGLSVYGATKAALQAWSTSLRVELTKYGLSVVQFVPGSFTKESSIMAHQNEHFDDMRAGMSEEAKQFYGDYFENYCAYLSALSKDNGLVRIQNPKVYETFDGALLDKNPSALYQYEPWRYKCYHTLFSILPTSARDWLVERFIQMPRWSKEDRSAARQDNESSK